MTQGPGRESQDATLLDLTQATFLLMSRDRGSNAFFHFYHLFLHIVLEDLHGVYEVLAGGLAIEEALRKSCVFQGRPLFVQKLAEVNCH